MSIRLIPCLVLGMCILASPVLADNTRMDIKLELNREGKKQMVGASHVFRSGDKLRIHVTASKATYLYCLAVGSSGKPSLLFPVRSLGENHMVPGKAVTIPAKGYLQFDGTPGEEQLFLSLFKNRNKKYDQMIKNPGQNNSGQAKRDLHVVDDAPASQDPARKPDAQSGPKGGASEPVVVKLILKHR